MEGSCSLWYFLCSQEKLPSQHNWRLKKNPSLNTNMLLQWTSEVMTSCRVTIKKAQIRGRKLIFQTTACQHLSLPSLAHPAACQSSCATCSSRLGCQSCGSHQPLLGPDGSQCLASCPPGSYQANHTHCRREYRQIRCARQRKADIFDSQSLYFL